MTDQPPCPSGRQERPAARRAPEVTARGRDGSAEKIIPGQRQETESEREHESESERGDGRRGDPGATPPRETASHRSQSTPGGGRSTADETTGSDQNLQRTRVQVRPPQSPPPVDDSHQSATSAVLGEHVARGVLGVAVYFCSCAAAPTSRDCDAAVTSCVNPESVHPRRTGRFYAVNSGCSQ